MLRGSPSPDDSPAPDDRLPSPDASSLRPRPNTVSNRLYGGAGLSARAGCARMLRAAPGVEDHEVVDVPAPVGHVEPQRPGRDDRPVDADAELALPDADGGRGRVPRRDGAGPRGPGEQAA